MTNNHVAKGADKLSVTFTDGTQATAKLVGTDPDSDLAVIKVDLPKERLPVVQMADSSQVRVGNLAVAIGNPFGLEGTQTVVALIAPIPRDAFRLAPMQYQTPAFATEASVFRTPVCARRRSFATPRRVLLRSRRCRR